MLISGTLGREKVKYLYGFGNVSRFLFTDLMGKIVVVILTITNEEWKQEYVNMENMATKELVDRIKKAVSLKMDRRKETMRMKMVHFKCDH